MSDLMLWQKNNDRYLAASLEWLRIRLGQAARIDPSDQSAQPVEKPAIAADTMKAAQAKADAAKADPPPAHVMLGQHLGLSQFEQDILLLCSAMELDTRIPGLCAQAQNDPNRPYPTFALAFSLFSNPHWDALSAERPLRYWRLLDINQPGATPLTMSALRADERIVSYLKGLNSLDDRLASFIAPFDELGNGDQSLAASHQLIAGAIELQLRNRGVADRLPVIQLTGTDSISKQQVALRVLTRLGLQAFRMPGELLPVSAAEVETLARLWQRESYLLPLALYLDVSDSDEGIRTGEGISLLSRFLTRCGTLTFLDTREPRTGHGLNTLVYEVEKPLPAEQHNAWIEALGEAAKDIPARLSGQFDLNLPTIHHIALSVLADIRQEDNRGLHQQLWRSCLSRTRPRLDKLALRIESKATWNELVLPDEQLSLLHEISEQVRHRSTVYDAWGFRSIMNRGFGISALFAGESGTGKTMAAEVIARELHLDLYRIDLSAVVNKYIGETEKNLRRLFDAAEDGGMILFFDEADALFGRRSEVKDSHDRYANIEVNYLLQRMESFRGLAILATNMKSSLDQAFMRRLRFVVNFPFPGPAERKMIWERVFPKDNQKRSVSGTPTEALDHDHLARINLPGGNIHNVALNAAFLAARAGSAVTMPLILDAARTEFRKLERPVNEGDFRSLKPLGAAT
ncbi:MAG: ATP-binding protein [Desulfuromonadaceae bacterium]